jgi:hypothetical protein
MSVRELRGGGRDQGDATTSSTMLATIVTVSCTRVVGTMVQNGAKWYAPSYSNAHLASSFDGSIDGHPQAGAGGTHTVM